MNLSGQSMVEQVSVMPAGVDGSSREILDTVAGPTYAVLNKQAIMCLPLPGLCPNPHLQSHLSFSTRTSICCHCDPFIMKNTPSAKIRTNSSSGQEIAHLHCFFSPAPTPPASIRLLSPACLQVMVNLL